MRPMSHKYAPLAVFIAGCFSAAAIAQAPSAPPAPAPAAAAPATPAPVPPQAFPAKIALIAFESCVVSTNEGQRVLAEVQKKYEPKQAQLEALNTEIDTIKKKLQAAPATLSDAERASQMKTLDTKQKQLDRDTDDARTAYQADLQEAYGKVAQKVHAVLLNYVQQNGYTILFDVSSQDSPVMWAAREPSADITEAVVNAYNVSSGIAPPEPEAPTPAKSAAPHSTTAPHSTAPKPPSE